MRRQIRRHSTRRSSSSSSSSSSSRRRLSHLWTRLFHARGPRARGHALLLDAPRPTQVALGLQSYRTVSVQGPRASARSGAGLRDEAGALGTTHGSCCLANMELRPYERESPASPISFQSEDGSEGAGPSPLSGEGIRLQQFETLTPDQSPQEPSVGPCPPWASKKLILEFAVNLQGVSLRRYSPLGPLSPGSPSSQLASTSQPPSQGLEVALSPEPASSVSSTSSASSSSTSSLSSSSSSVKARDRHAAGVPSRRRRGKRKLSRLSRTFSDEGGGSPSTPC